MRIRLIWLPICIHSFTYMDSKVHRNRLNIDEFHHNDLKHQSTLLHWDIYKLDTPTNTKNPNKNRKNAYQYRNGNSINRIVPMERVVVVVLLLSMVPLLLSTNPDNHLRLHHPNIDRSRRSVDNREYICHLCRQTHLHDKLSFWRETIAMILVFSCFFFSFFIAILANKWFSGLKKIEWTKIFIE